MARAKADIGGELPDAPTPAAQGQPKPPPLPTAKSGGAKTKLEEVFTLIYGPNGIGKSTLASQFPRPIFFDCSGELDGVECYSMPTPTWREFLGACWAIKEDAGKTFGTVVIDTGDMLIREVAGYSNNKIGLAHASEGDYGRGWSAIKDEFFPAIAKLRALPGIGLVIVSHSNPKEIKTATETYNRWLPTCVGGGIGDYVLDQAHLILYMDYDSEDQRVIHTKPSRYHAAKERGINPRLPAEIPWEIGSNGYDLMNQHWEAKAS